MKKLLVLLSLLLSSPALANVPCSLPFNLTNGTIADATQVMANYNAIVACLGNAAEAGANSDITALLGLTTPLAPSEGGTSVFLGGTSSGTNAQVVATTTPSVFTLTTGYTVVYIAGGTNAVGSGVTLAVDATGAHNFYRQTPSGAQAMTGGEIQSGQIVVAQWDGTQFELINSSAQFGGFGPLTQLSSASTTSLGTIASHNVNVTGGATITTFGADASVTYPVYQLTFASTPTITYNQTNCSTTGNCINTPTQGNIIVTAGDTAVAQYLGAGSGGGGNWNIIDYQRQNGTPLVNPAPLCGANNLKIVNDSGTPNTKIDITADSVVMINPTGNVPIYRTSVSVVINDTVNGANGLDTGSLGNNTFYYHYLIDNGTAAAGLDSASSTSPSMPSGYTYLCRIGATKTNGSANFYGTRQLGRSAQYVVGGANLTALPQAATGTVGSVTVPTYVAVTLQGNSGAAVWVPGTASVVHLVAQPMTAGGQIIVAPNASYGSISSTSNPAPVAMLNSAGGNTYNFPVEMVLESTSVQWASNGTNNSLAVMGWTDLVNAN